MGKVSKRETTKNSLGMTKTRTSPRVINLGEFRDEKYPKIFIGKTHGEWVRSKSKIDAKVALAGPITIEIPNDILQVDVAFLRALLHNVILQAEKPSDFKNMIKFSIEGNLDIEDELKEAIDSTHWKYFRKKLI
jgi:hypothetical protein